MTTDATIDGRSRRGGLTGKLAAKPHERRLKS
jgi:hypothetical protein